MKIDCLRQGKHNLIEIYEYVKNDYESKVVRWCQDCGAIVIDIDCDGRTQPGAVMEMRLPKIYSER